MNNTQTDPSTLSENYPFDRTKITWDISEERDESELTVYAYQDDAGNEIPDADITSGAYMTFLEYPNEAALKRAKQTRRLGRHQGNVVIVFPNDDLARVSVYGWRNSATTGEDLSSNIWQYIWSRCLPIPVAMAKRIHPRAFYDMYAAFEWCERAGDETPLTIKRDEGYQAYCAGKLDSGNATFGDGTPVPDEYVKPSLAWMAEGH